MLPQEPRRDSVEGIDGSHAGSWCRVACIPVRPLIWGIEIKSEDSWRETEILLPSSSGKSERRGRQRIRGHAAERKKNPPREPKTSTATIVLRTGSERRRSPMSIATGRRGLLEENLSGSPKAEARAGAVVE